MTFVTPIAENQNVTNKEYDRSKICIYILLKDNIPDSGPASG